jgi:hypothetical protein
MSFNLHAIAALQGHIDSNFGDERWFWKEGSPRYTFWFLGDDPDGPAVFCVSAPPNPEGKETGAHSHGCDQVRMILEGRFKVGTKWYGPAEMRIQDANRIYGPEVVAPEGCKYIVVFEKRSGIIPRFVKADEPGNIAVVNFLKNLIAPACTPKVESVIHTV